ncbi:Morn repeat domain containing protein [Pandoravirus dulcis]|uniref:Morn repeat domain containing protein n=1 Tax=Pandoravirus dulcis TaxID=1349409 RepID=S4VYD2_9VIRU|nr:Morn repeat domain containing protein [Pandoravirus dulcis]AGO82894.1 Morn repeat domain containing protein [Pandoravirus dulcis]
MDGDRGVKRRPGGEHPSGDRPHALYRAATNKRPRTRSLDRLDNLFDRLPDELVVAILAATADAGAVVRWASTCTRHRRLAMDPLVWRDLCRARFGAHLLHARFQDAGKDWRWLYRAQASVARADGRVDDVGACLVDVIARPPERTKRAWVYWGDLVDGLSDGYGVCLRLPSIHCADAPHPARSAVHDPHVVDDMGAAGAARSYEGQWKAGRYHGHGVHIDGLGTRYEGGWKEGQRHGYAVARFADGGVYEGHWQDNARHGHGTSRYANGTIYEGEWRSNRHHGRGVRTEPCGAVYEGQFEHGLLCGQGSQRSADGVTTYEGEWNAGRHHGHGVCRYADGSSYEGDWRDGVRHGHGIYTFASGTTYDGDWVDGHKHG